MDHGDPLLAAIDKLTRRRKVGVLVERHVHDWHPCEGHHPDERDVVRMGTPVDPSAPAIVRVDPGVRFDPEVPEVKPRPAHYVERVLEPMPCVEWWQREAVDRLNVGIPQIDAVRYGWAMGRSERCEMLVCSGCSMVVTEEPADDPLELHMHTEIHDPLLVLLMAGDGGRHQSTGGEHGLPVDAEAIRMRDDIQERLLDLGKAVGFKPRVRGLARQMRSWYLAVRDAESKRKVTPAFVADVTREVEQWVHEIERKFDPAESREWTHACPRCGARRPVVDGLERFAIRLNVTNRRAECVSCETVWEGERGLRHLRYETNLAATAKAPSSSDLDRVSA